MKKIFILLLLLCSLQLFSQTIYYVKTTGNDANSGDSWATAFKTLQKAISIIGTKEIWVAAGTYYPDEGPGLTDNDRSASFHLKSGVGIYGGFGGFEADLNQRSWQTVKTILSGEIQRDGDSTNNSFSVVRSDSVNPTAILDGVTITGGYTAGSGGGLYNSYASPTIANCTITGNWAEKTGAGIYNYASSPTISNCTITGNMATTGAGMYNDGASPTITQCTFIRNMASDDGAGMCNNNTTANITNCSFIGNKAGNGYNDLGGGMYNNYGWPQVTNCTFTGNTAGVWGGGMSNDHSSPTVVNCRFSENSAGYDGGGIFNDYCAAQILNCIFWKNWAGHGGGAGNRSSNAQFTNCTFWNNSAMYSGGGIYSYYYPPTLINCILWGNIRGQIDNYNTYTYITYSIVQGGWGGMGNLSTNPLFVNTAGDLHLQDGSPAINAGNNDILPSTLTTDLDGRPRILYGRVDMGAYEYSIYKGIIYVKKEATGTNNGSSWANAFTSLQDALALAAPNPDLNQVWVAAGTYYPDEGTGMTDNDRSASFVLKQGVTIYGGFAGTETNLGQRDPLNNAAVLSGDIDGDSTLSGNAYHVVTAAGVDHTAILNDVTITGGNADGPMAPNSQGGGLYISSANPRIHYCTFSDNAANQGGAVYTAGSFPSFGWCYFSANTAATGGALYNGGLSQTSLLDVHFTRNTATHGGAIYNEKHTVLHLTNGLFFQNSATGPAAGPYKGGAIYNASAYNYLLHGSFSANTASPGAGGAVYNENSSPFITNSILWGNSSEIDNDATSNPTVSYSLVQGGYPAGTNILDHDPLFRDAAGGDLRLKLGSPAIDAGNKEEDTYVYTDLDGRYRIQGPGVDMGAYEYASATSPPPLMLSCPESFTLQSEATSCGAVVEFTGEQAATAIGGKAPVTISYEPASGSLLPVGENTITVTATDNTATIKTCSFTVTVAEGTPPVITGASATPSILYPPNHKMQEVQVNYTVSDNCPGVTTSLSITSNQPEYGTGSGDTGPDWQVISDHKLKLRAERSGNGKDRVYTIALTATDASGNTSTTAVTVTVPHDNGRNTSALAANTSEAVGLFLTVIPNPSAEGFTLYTQSPSALPLTIRVMDGAGRILESRKGVVANGTLYIGNNYRPGVYYVQVMQGDAMQTIKLVKQGR